MTQKRVSVRPNSPTNRWKPDINKIMLDQLTKSVLELKRQEEEDNQPQHTEPVDGVYYQLKEEASVPEAVDTSHQTSSPSPIRERYIMGFKAFCEAYDQGTLDVLSR